MKKIAVSDFKARCLSILDHVDDDGILITKHGRPVAKLVPYRDAPVDLIGGMKGQLEIRGDITSTGIGWDAQS